MKKYIIIICLALSVILSVSAIDEIDKKSQELLDIKRNKAKLEKERKSVITKERSVLAETKVIEKQLIVKEKELRTYELNLSQCEIELDRLGKALAEAEKRAEQTRSTMLKRLRAMYKLSYDGNQMGYLKFLLDSDSASDLMNKYKYMNAIANGDRILMERAAAEKEEVAEKKKQVEARKGQILYYKKGTERLKNEIARKGEIRRNTLSKLRKSKEQLTRTINELEQSVRALESLITQLRNNQNGSYTDIDDLEKMYGRLPWPTTGKIIENASPSMRGLTIQAVYGSDIRAVASGVVEYSQWFDGVGFGQMVIINHGKGYRTLYAHASELLVEKGERVKKDQVIAKVGNTGSFKGSLLYFEIWNGTRAMPTRQWLR